jgi:hypothetical protein
MILDAGYLSTFTYKDIGGKLKMTVWDFNNGFNSYTGADLDPSEFCLSNNNWFKRLLQDRNFTQKVVNRYHELRKGVLSDDYLLKAIDDKVKYLGDAVDRNFNVWGYIFKDNMLIGDRDPTSYDEAIRMLKDEIVSRGKFLDGNIEALYQYAVN